VQLPELKHELLELVRIDQYHRLGVTGYDIVTEDGIRVHLGEVSDLQLVMASGFHPLTVDWRGVEAAIKQARDLLNKFAGPAPQV
jgi:hypothetical protein